MCMKIEIKVELDRLEMEKFEAKIEAEIERWERVDDYYCAVADMEHENWLEWWAKENYNLLGN